MLTIVVTLGEIIGLGFIAVVIIISIVAIIFESICNLFKKNCYKCKYWQLDSVAGSGGICHYRCNKHQLDSTVMQDFNDEYHYERCKEFESLDKSNGEE